MAHTDHFRMADDLIVHLDPVLTTLGDPFIESRYTGFLAVSCVTVMELALKEIFCEFSKRKHDVLGNFCFQYFDRINGRIGLGSIKTDYLKKFGNKYLIRFEKRIEAQEKSRLRLDGTSIKSSYGNLITWRNSFAHEGVLPPNASYGEVKKGYECGKDVLACLAGCMNR